jgi:phenylacetic acid degradation operon negative regulatory protein
MPAKFHFEEFLTLLEYGFDVITLPGLRKLDLTYESWVYSKRLLRRMHYLEREKYLTKTRDRHDWVFELTEKARLRIYGGRDPEKQWQRSWDGLWRQIIFDLPTDRRRERAALIRWLRNNGFGYLQDSVWIRPDPVEDIAEQLKEYRNQADSLAILEGHSAPGFGNASLVVAAWPFERINKTYRDYQNFAASVPKRLSRLLPNSKGLFHLLQVERQKWAAAFHLDPLLPIETWPRGYEGQRAWHARRKTLELVGRHTAKS